MQKFESVTTINQYKLDIDKDEQILVAIEC